MERQRRFDAPVKPDVTVTQKRETARSQTWREHVQPDIDINMANLPRSMELDIMCDYRKNSTRRRKHDERPAFKIRIGHNFVNEIEEKITFTKSCGNLSYKRDAAILKLGNTVYSLPVEKQQKNTDFCGKLDELKHGKSKIPKYQQLHKLGLEYPVFYDKTQVSHDITKNDDKLPKLPGETRVQSRNKSTKTTLELSTAESENKSKKREEVKFLIPKNIKAPFRRQSERYGQLNPLAQYLTPSKNKVTCTDTTDSLRTHTGSFSSSDDDDDVGAEQSTQTEIETETVTNKPERKHRTTDIKRSLSKLKLKNGLTSIDIAEDLPDTINEDTKTRRQLRQIYPMYNYEIEQRNRNTHEKFSRLQNSSNRLVLDNMERSITDIKRYTPNLPKERQEYRKLYGYSMRNLNPKDILMAPDKTGDLYMEISFSDTRDKRKKVHSSDSKSRFWYSPVPNPPPTADAAYRRDPSALNSEKSTLAASVIGERTDDINTENGCDELKVENKRSDVIEEVCSHDLDKNDVNKEVYSDHVENADVKITIENASSDDVSKSVDSEKAEKDGERNLCVSESDVNNVENVDVNKTSVSDNDDVVLNNQIDNHGDTVPDAISDVISDCEERSDTISSECERTTQRYDSPIYVDLKNVEVPVELHSEGKLQSENENDLSINNDLCDAIDVDLLKVSFNNQATMLPRTPRHSPDLIEPPKLNMKALQQNINASLDSLVVDDEDLTPRTPTQSPELKDTDGVCDDLEPKLKALCEDTIADSLVEERDNEIVANTVDIDTNNSNTKKLAKESLNTQNNTDENSDSLTSNNKLYRDEMIITHSTNTNINNSDEHKKKITIEGNYNRYSNTNKDDSNNDHNSIVNIIETDVNSSDSNGISNKNSSTNNNIKHKNKNNNSSNNNNHSNNSNTDIITNNNIKNTSTTNNLIVPSTVIHISHDNDEANDVMTADQKEKMVRDVKNMAEFTKVDSRRTGMRRSDKLTFSGCATALLSIPKVMTGEKRPPLTSRSVGCDMPNKQPLQKRQSAPGLTRRYLEIPDFKTIQRRLPRKTSYDEKSTRILEQDSERKRDIGRKNSDVVSKSQQNGKTVESKPKVTAKDITFVTPTIRF